MHRHLSKTWKVRLLGKLKLKWDNNVNRNIKEILSEVETLLN
jgi:hypothetical protein